MIFLNQLHGVRAGVMMPKTGAWMVDVDVDLDTVPVVPTGPAVLALGPVILNGKVDDRASGRFGAKAHVRVVGGGGWDKPIPALELMNDAGVLSTAVFSLAASLVQEVVVELQPPKRLGAHYARMKGAASQVFAGFDWWVDILGVTHVGPRPPLPAPITADILEWDPTTKVAIIASDILIVPGMTLTDPIRFGVATVEDVEHTFDENGARAIAWCSTPSVSDAAALLLKAKPASGGPKVIRGLAALARQACNVPALKDYTYRVVTQGPDGRVNLQNTDPLGSEAPLFLKLVEVWPGLPGVKVKFAPASIVTVTFLDGDLARPRVTDFDPKNPPAIEISFAALKVVVGALGRAPVALATPTFLAWIGEVTTYINGLAPGTCHPPVDVPSLILKAD